MGVSYLFCKDSIFKWILNAVEISCGSIQVRYNYHDCLTLCTAMEMRTAMGI